jgi:predicted RNase H-like HicB family nuclease
MQYMIVIEKGRASYGAYVPDLPGCVAVAKTKREAIKLIKEAIVFHIEALVEDGEMIPKPHCEPKFVNVEMA